MMVTDRRIIEVRKSVFLKEEMNEIPFERVTNIHHEKNGFLQNIMNYGTLRIDSNVGKPIRMHFVPCSEDKFAQISNLYGGYIGKKFTIASGVRQQQRNMRQPSEKKTNEIRTLIRSFFYRTIIKNKKV